VLTLRVQKDPSAELGLEFEPPVFEGIRECNNHCEFCFIRGLPPGLRPSLYVFDDDYRYSFLYGNFLTLTNLDESDWERIAYQKLSPLYVSVHATDLGVRRRLLVNPRAPDILAQLDRLATAGVRVHCQIVLCAGINDGSALDRSLRDLSQRYPGVQSVAIVPVGLTRFSQTRNIRRPTREEACAALRCIREHAQRMRAAHGVGFCYGSDELYLLADRQLPGTSAYDDFPQLQNGVGLLRLMLGAWSAIRRHVPSALDTPRRVGWLCGRAVEPAMRRMAADLERVRGLTVDVVVVRNEFFGEGVTVSGLLAGQDLLAALRSGAWDRAIVPRGAFGFEGTQTLDGVSLHELQAAVSFPVIPGSTVEELLKATVA
jgi:putative radical SAM enzyme (TIGR03279 family)